MAATRRSVCIHQMNRVNSRNDCHDDSTINIVSNIIIIIISESYANTSQSQSVYTYYHTNQTQKFNRYNNIQKNISVHAVISTASNSQVYTFMHYINSYFTSHYIKLQCINVYSVLQS